MKVIHNGLPVVISKYRKKKKDIDKDIRNAYLAETLSLENE